MKASIHVLAAQDIHVNGNNITINQTTTKFALSNVLPSDYEFKDRTRGSSDYRDWSPDFSSWDLGGKKNGSRDFIQQCRLALFCSLFPSYTIVHVQTTIPFGAQLDSSFVQIR
ncbi:hypothetical protein LRAMOSA05090 [Lichtheimia ramosa]|uniref:Uncharacterized protein n=1 Tax=Lichtheimia ramosa TaxID=688394 RepID=A0A077WZ67_9FUNG|nr:hypothetical protein LRAMOSA05090 [Lichtheimia ramosa]